ncbi:hypothetical protein BGX38DRAFT_258527 [Terfezia claveryi]|nr:hypothetical protein BGX38DRAFT_258527 [Terfezia claveryi]
MFSKAAVIMSNLIASRRASSKWGSPRVFVVGFIVVGRGVASGRMISPLSRGGRVDVSSGRLVRSTVASRIPQVRLPPPRGWWGCCWRRSPRFPTSVSLHLGFFRLKYLRLPLQPPLHPPCPHSGSLRTWALASLSVHGIYRSAFGLEQVTE